mgnify:CR=1 FL=1
MLKTIPLQKGLVTIDEAARCVGRTRVAVCCWVRAGLLPAAQIGPRGPFLVRLADAQKVARSIVRGRPRKAGAANVDKMSTFPGRPRKTGGAA